MCLNIGTYMSVHFPMCLSTLYIFIYHKSLPNANFCSTWSLVYSKGKKDERHVHYNSLHSDQVPDVTKKEKETIINHKKLKQNLNNDLPLKNWSVTLKTQHNLLKFLKQFCRFFNISVVSSIFTRQDISMAVPALIPQRAELMLSSEEETWLATVSSLTPFFILFFFYFNAKHQHHTNPSA